MMRSDRAPFPFRRFLAAIALAGSALHPWTYTNTYGPSGVNFAINTFTGKTLAAQSSAYNDVNAAGGASTYDADAPIFFANIGSAVSPLHHFLGFVDVIVSPVYSLTNLPWKMYGDNDLRNTQDLRAVDSANTTWDMIDTNYKATTRGFSFNNSNCWITTTALTGNANLARFGEFCVARFQVPPDTNSGYFLNLGLQTVRIGNVGSEQNYNGTAQLNVYTVNVTNALAVRASLSAPFQNQFKELTVVQKIAAVPGPVQKVVAGQAVTFQADVWNTTGSSVATYEWDLGTGSYQTGAATATTTFQTKGTYQVNVRVTTAAGMTASNTGSPCDPLANFQAQTPDQNPPALPCVVQVVDAPTANAVGNVRPSPFLLGISTSASLDINLATPQDVQVTVRRIDGTPIRSLLNASQQVGFLVAQWDGKDDRGRYAGEGLYYFSVITPTLRETRQISVLRPM